MAGNQATRRMLAVLYTDQVGSTAMSRALGDQVFDQVRREIEQAITHSMARHTGTVVKKTGDGALVVFESAADAIDAAIALHKAVDEIPARGEHRATMRIGLAVGDVSVEGGDCFGTPVIEAARLEAAAPAAGILCTDLVRMLAGSRTGASFIERGPMELKGFDTPVAVCEIPWTRAAIAGGAIAESLTRQEQLAFVGRREDLAVLDAAIDRGEARGVLVAGEPGAGKSRLVREVARRAASNGAIVLHGRSDEGMGRPYQPFAEALLTFLRLDPDGIDQLGTGAAELRHVLPELATMVPGLSEPMVGDPDSVRFRLFEAIVSWLKSAAVRRSVVVVIDDLHWADHGTGQLVRHLLDALDREPVVVVVTYRDTEPDGDVDLTQLVSQLRRLENVDRIRLDGLGVDDLQALLASVGPHLADADLAELLRERTGGNAFFAAEVVRAISRSDGAGEAIELIPDAVQDVVVARVGQLSADARELLDVAAVFGRISSYDQLGRALEWSQRRVAVAADEVVSAGLLRELDDPPLHLQFPHSLVRTAHYDSLSARMRSLLHASAAATLLQLDAERLDGVAEQLAGHFARTNVPDDGRAAIDWYRRAAARDRRQAAEAAAAGQYRRALAVLDQPGMAVDPRLKCELLVELGDALRRARLEGYRGTLLEAGALARQHGFDDLLVATAMVNTRGFFSAAGASDHERISLLRDALVAESDPTPTRARLLSNLSVELTFETDFAERLALSDEAVEIAREHGSDDDLFHVLGMRYGTLWTAHTLRERTELAVELGVLADAIDRDELRYVAAWSGFQAAMESGDLELADEMLRAQEAISEATPTQRSYLNIRQGLRAAVAGDLDAAEQHVIAAFEFAATAGEPDAFTFYFSQLASLRYHQGRMDELTSTFEMAVDNSPGLPALRAGLGLIHLEAGRLDDAARVVDVLGSNWRAVGDELNWLITIALLAEEAAALHRRSLCAELYPALAPHRSQFVDNATNWFGSVARFLALLEHELGRFDDADRSFAEALDAHQRLATPLLESRTHLQWGMSLVDRPNPRAADAAARFAAALDLAKRYGLANVERLAAHALSATADRPRR